MNLERMAALSTADSRTFHSQPSSMAAEERLELPMTPVLKPEPR